MTRLNFIYNRDVIMFASEDPDEIIVHLETEGFMTKHRTYCMLI